MHASAIRSVALKFKTDSEMGNSSVIHKCCSLHLLSRADDLACIQHATELVSILNNSRLLIQCCVVPPYSNLIHLRENKGT